MTTTTKKGNTTELHSILNYFWVKPSSHWEVHIWDEHISVGSTECEVNAGLNRLCINYVIINSNSHKYICFSSEKGIHFTTVSFFIVTQWAPTIYFSWTSQWFLKTCQWTSAILARSESSKELIINKFPRVSPQYSRFGIPVGRVQESLF